MSSSLKRIFSPDKNHLFQKNDLELNGLTTPTTSIKMPLTAKNIFKNNGGNIMYNNNNNSPLFTSPNNTKKENLTDLFNLESKINSLESKLYILEQTNA
jgi:hypothetical protein